MCDDFGSDSGGFDDVGSSDFDSDIVSDFDSDVSSDFDTDFSADIDTMDFDDVETIDFDDDMDSDFDSSDISDDIETIDFDDDIETLAFEDDIETMDIDDDIETLDIDDDIETIDVDDIETLDTEENVEISELNENTEDMNMDDISEDDFETEEENFDDLDTDIAVEDADFEDDLAEMEEMSEDIEAESVDTDNDIDSMDYDSEIETMDMDEEFENIEAIDSDEISEDSDFDNEIEDIDISEDIEAMNLDDVIEGEDIVAPDSTEDMELDIPDETEFTNPEESEFNYPDAPEYIEPDVSEFSEIPLPESEENLNNSFEDVLTDLETENSYPGDMPNYIELNEVLETPETIDWESMLSDGDRDYINGIMNNDNYTQEQKDFLVQEALGEIYERETAEPEYGAGVKGLTYDGRDIITKPPEDYSNEPYINEELLDGVLNNDNLTSENLSNLRDYLESISDDESLTDDEKSFLINQALGAMSDTNAIRHDSYSNPSSLEGIKETNVPTEVRESIDEGTVNEYNEPFLGELSEQDIDAIYEGLNEYDFHGVDCFEDTERLDSSLENFTSENWENLSLDEQKEHMTDLAQYIIDVTGLENPPKIEFYNSGKDGDYGGFDRTTNTLSINEHMLYQNDEAADTVAHELWHAYQYERASNPSTKLDHMYLENFNDYITPDDDFEGYQSQILESEARAFAQQIKDRLHSY